MSEKDLFYFEKDEPIRSCLLALRNIILEQDKNMLKTKKYGMPCFCINKKPLSYLWLDKKSGDPYLLFVDGNLLDHPLLHKGKRKKMKILNLNPSIDLQKQLINSLLQKAINLKKTNQKITTQL